MTRAEAASKTEVRRSPDAKLEEAVGLAAAINLEIIDSAVITQRERRPATLIGPGKVEELKGIIAAGEIALVIFDHPLTPVQQRNLEKELNAKVLDRTALILEIFGERARTKEGRLQVELAHLNYQRGRLVRSWTHLERQRGGAGFLGGPGETQIEADRRQLQSKIKGLEAELDQVRRTRQLHRAKRQKRPHPIVALVGYTNAGKSTLFNRMTGADVFAKDLLFATLDPTLRRTTLSHGTEILFSDTVGFISELPTHLVAAFRATLEEVIEADIILHVRDVADPDTLAQADDVRQILRDLKIDADDSEHVVEIWNKIDLLDASERERIGTLASNMSGINAPHLVSAHTGDGIDALLVDIERRIAGRVAEIDVTLDSGGMSHLSWIYQNASVLERQDLENGSVHLQLQMTQQGITELNRLKASGTGIRLG
ncbi:GTPase HflX [Fulvimarina sp. 2208YS6-2-32]|uniref:GTPase HflX n=2 Tax=Fulvimarina uroteuthidis TaxID=3098149 RepID=A0ABU5I5H6_9HYPH|nr:GTPase HflX [Fulvimarina sp. 2208YS6-2-32]MDY8110365.1 GTPase HflX [Fulvimarina sp. 2208YS6-2-32]